MNASLSHFGIATLLAVLLFVLAAACDERKSPTSPNAGQFAITLENVAAIATKRVAVEGPFTYQVSLALSETGGAGATISQVTATLSEMSGARTETQVSATEAFGTTRIPANGTLAATGISVTGLLQTANEITVRVTFTDDKGNVGSAQTSTGVRLDLNGDWSGPFQISTQPPADWSIGRAALVKNGDSLTGELVSRDGVRFTLSGSVSREWAPTMAIGGLFNPNGPCGLSLLLTEFEFTSGRLSRIAGRPIGRCPGTACCSFEVQRTA